MIEVGKKVKEKPVGDLTKLQKEIYNVFEKLDIHFERVDTTDAITMEDCIKIDEVLDVKTVKTLFLANRQETIFYLFVTTADKMFSTKKFSEQLNISRVSFGKEYKMKEMLGTLIGAATPLSTIIDKENKVNIVIDRDVLKEEYIGCTDGTRISYMKIRLGDLIEKIIPYSLHSITYIDM